MTGVQTCALPIYLLALRPQVGSIAAVPAGVTDYRKGLYKLILYDKETAAATLDILEEFAQKCRAEYGRSVIYPSDEWYLTAERPLPPAEFYDAFAQLEDGVGMWRLYHDTFLEELENYTGLVLPHSMDVVTTGNHRFAFRKQSYLQRPVPRLLEIKTHPSGCDR